MRAILIDPFTETVTEVDHTGGLEDIYNWTDCVCITSCNPFSDREHTMFLDDEGLYRDDQAFFGYVGYGQPLAGRALVVGVDEAGETVACKLSLEGVRAHVGFLPDLKFVGMTPMVETDIEHPVFGKMKQLSSVPVFTKKDEQ